MRLRGNFFYLLLLAAVLAALFFAGARLARAGISYPDQAGSTLPQGVIVRFEPAVQTVKLGESFEVSVVIEGLEAPLSAYQFDLVYDAGRLKMEDSAPQGFLSSTGRVPVCPTPVQLQAGRVRTACVGAGEAAGPTGSGSLVKLKFNALLAGTTNLSLSALQLAGPGVPAEVISAGVQGGTVNVVQQPEYWLYLPLTIKK